MNSGNIASWSATGQQSFSRTFTYDELNRIKTAQSAATSGGDCWGLQYSFDIYANLLSAAVTKCSETALSLSVDTKNRSYAWDAESRMKSGADVNYTYDGDGRRAKKDNGREWN